MTRFTRFAAPSLVAGALLAALATTPALGHSDVTASSPAHGSTLTRVPARMTVTFGDAIGRLGSMTVTRNGSGNLVKATRTSPTNARTAVITLTRPGPKKQAGLYRLTWRIVGADGHRLTGVIAFRVRPR